MCITMNKRKYRLFVICCLVLDLLVMLISGYRYLDRKIPDEIQISRGKKTEDVTEVLSTPFVTFEEAVTVSQHYFRPPESDKNFLSDLFFTKSEVTS